MIRLYDHFSLSNHKSLSFRHTHGLTCTPFHKKVATSKTSLLVNAHHILPNTSESRQNQTWLRSNSVTSTNYRRKPGRRHGHCLVCWGMYLQHKKRKKKEGTGFCIDPQGSGENCGEESSGAAGGQTNQVPPVGRQRNATSHSDAATDCCGDDVRIFYFFLVGYI